MKIVDSYDYQDDNGELLFQTVRYEPKDFRQRRPDGRGGFIWNIDGVPRVLYRLPELCAADPELTVFICEGEKDVDRLLNELADENIAVTCNSGGAGKWHLVDDSPLHDRHVCILPDNDKKGRDHAEGVAKALHGKAAEVRVLPLRSLPDKGDVSDWFDNGGTVEELWRLVDTAPLWTSNTNEEKAISRRPILRSVDQVQAEQTQWLWRDRIPIGKVTLLAGDPGLGKSLLSLDIASRLSRGVGYVDNQDSPLCGSVVLLSAEDDIADTIRPRLDAAGADVSRVFVLEAVQNRDPDTGEEVKLLFSLISDLPALEAAIRTIGDVKLVIIDPVTAYLGNTDSHKNAEIRGLLAPLADLAAKHKVAILAVTHLNKNASVGSALYRAMGSLAFVATARAVWAVVKDKEQPARRLMLPVKNNLAPEPTGLAYEVVDAGNGQPQIRWDARPVTISVDEALGGNDDQKCERRAAKDWLLEALDDGSVSSTDLFNQAKKDGINEKTLRRAGNDLNIEPRKLGFQGKWMWELPKDSKDAHP